MNVDWELVVAGVSALVAVVSVIITIRQARDSKQDHDRYVATLTDLATSARHLQVLEKAYSDLSRVSDQTSKYVYEAQGALVHTINRIMKRWEEMLHEHVQYLSMYPEEEKHRYARLLQEQAERAVEGAKNQAEIYLLLRNIANDLQARAEQVGTGQPATRPESKSEGSQKPQPEAEGRSR